MEDYKVLQTGDEIQEILNQAPVDTADIAGLKEAATSLDGRLEAVEGKIPSGASSENPLTDKQYVDSSIASASATFRGTYNEVTDLELTTDATHADIGSALDEVIELADSNDYCFVQIPTDDETPMEIDSIERYKFVTGTGWEYEYTLNNSGFTAGQWAAINSGITSGLVTKLTDLPTNAELENLLNGKANATDVYTKSETYNKTELDAQLGAKANSADVYEKSQTYTKQEVDALITTPEVQYVTVTATSGTTSVTDVLPATGAANTIYRVGSWDGTQYATGVYSEYSWNGTTYILLDVKNYGFATGSDFDNPTTAQRELVTTVGSVLDGISEGVFDLTAKTGDSYATLADALTDANTSIPTNKKKGGMSIKFVQSSDNKYVQYRLMSDTFNTTPSNWQGVDDEPTAGSDNLVTSGGSLANGITGFPLVSIASGLSGANITAAGQYYFNTTQKKVKYCKTFVDATHGTYIDIDPIDGALYTVGEKIFIYDTIDEEMKYIPISKIADEARMIEGKGFEQAEYILIKDASSSTAADDADGTRLRVVFNVENAGCIRMSSSYRYLINIYNTLVGAIAASSSPKETITGASSYSWYTGLIEHDFASNSGFLSISFRKDDDSIITVEDKAAILGSTKLNIYRHIKEVDILKEKLSVVESIQNTQYHIEQVEFNDYVINLSENISKLIVDSNVSSIQGVHIIGKNLVDQSTIKVKKIINDSGVEVTDSSSSYYDCTIPCHGKTIKSNYTMQRIYMYDSNMQFLGRESASNVRYLYVVPDNVWFIKIQIKSVSNISDYCAIFDNGIDDVSYSAFREYSDIPNDETCNIYTSGITQVEVEVDVVCKALIPAIKEYQYWEPSEVTNDYSCTPLGQYAQSIPSLNTLGYRGFLEAYYDVYLGDYADGYSVTKEELGMDSGAVVEHVANPIFSYTFAPKYYNKTVLLSAGMNTCEASTYFGLAYFIKALMEHTEAGMLALYNTTRFVVIPVICPTGISHDPLLYRNANDVRINKNFSYLDSWIYNYNKGGQYPGAYPDSEVETKILKEWLNRYAGSTFYMDCHSDTGGSTEQHLSLTVCFCSDSDTVDKLQYRKSDVEQFYRDKGYIQVGETPTMTYRAVVNDYPKTPYSYYICRTPALMHEQYCHSTMYGSDGDTNNDSYGIKHYCALIRWYVLIMCRSNVEIVL